MTLSAYQLFSPLCHIRSLHALAFSLMLAVLASSSDKPALFSLLSVINTAFYTP